MIKDIKKLNKPIPRSVREELDRRMLKPKHVVNGQDRNIIEDNPRVNEWMIKQGGRKIEFLKQYREVGPEIMWHLEDIMRPIDEKKEYERYW